MYRMYMYIGTVHTLDFCIVLHTVCTQYIILVQVHIVHTISIAVHVYVQYIFSVRDRIQYSHVFDLDYLNIINYR